MRWSFSPANAWSRAASAVGSRRLNRASAASSRTSGSGLIRVSEPTAASMVPRRRLLTRTRSRSASVAAARRLAGDGFAQRQLVAVGLADDHELVGCADIELAGRQGLEDRRGARLARGRQRADRRLALAEIAGGEIADEGGEIGGQGPAGHQQRGQRRQQHDERTRGRTWLRINPETTNGATRKSPRPCELLSAEAYLPLPPHFLVTTLKLPQFIGCANRRSGSWSRRR